jgi:protein disulfide-isomerase A1
VLFKMRKSVYLLGAFCALLLLTVSVRGDDDDDDDEDDEEEAGDVTDFVQVLTDASFADAVKSNPIMLVEFYAPWCGHCKTLEPEYKAAAAILKPDGIVLAKVDATVEKESAAEHNVEGFPTLVFFRDGKSSAYGGGRTTGDIVSWLKKKAGPVTTPLADKAAVDAFLKDNEVAVIGYFSADSELSSAFAEAAKAEEEVPFGLAAGAFAGVEDGKLAVFRHFDEPRVDYAGAAEAEAVSAFVKGESLPLVIPFNEKNSQKIFGSSIKKHVLLFADDDEKALAAFKAGAQESKGEYIFVSVGADQTQILEFFGVSVADMPTIFSINQSEKGMDKYKFTEAMDEAGVKTFMAALKAGTIAKFLKSEEVPETETVAGVTTLVGKNFDKFARDATKDVLVEFYAPWCGHCKKLEPIWKKLGKQFEDVESVIIAKVDSTANDIDGVDVQGFPTIMFFPANNKDEPLKYEGDRDLKGFRKYLKKNAHIKFDLPKKPSQKDKEEL